MSESKIKIKLGQFELEFEGSEEFIKNDLPILMKNVSELLDTMEITEEVSDQETEKAVLLKEEKTKTSKNWGPSTIAQKLQIQTGKELVIAACVYLTIVAKKKTFTRKDILSEMKSATAYYQDNHSKNLTRYLNQLIKSGVINESSSNRYALAASTKAEMEKTLAG